jgi:hypothetical protein
LVVNGRRREACAKGLSTRDDARLVDQQFAEPWREPRRDFDRHAGIITDLTNRRLE